MAVTNTLTETGGKTAAEFQLRRIVVAHDGSTAAARAYKDAIALAKRYGSEIILAHVRPPAEDFPEHLEYSEDVAELKALREQLTTLGIRGKVVVRAGIVGDTLFDISHHEHADLLMLGAYGRGSVDRLTLGSTAEHLLRSLPCPAITYGPEVKYSFLDHAINTGPILIPVPLPFELIHLELAASIARLFNLRCEIIHIANSAHELPHHEAEYQCRDLAMGLRREGLDVSWSLINGIPNLAEVYINAYCGEHRSPFILIPLERRNRLSSITSDNVAAQVIRRATVPVMTYRID